MKKTGYVLASLSLSLVTLLASCSKDEVVVSEVKGQYRPATAKSKKTCNRVWEYTPAPGQFINETSLASADEAAEFALSRLERGLYVSLGGFGGYIVVGFDHSILSSDGDYDFAVAGNAFYRAGTTTGGSNEPGIVYVMQDANGNGRPDDTWFELKGSDTLSPSTLRDYEVTYTRPDSPGKSVSWTDNRGGEGSIDYLSVFHKQDYYYPAWVETSVYILGGTCLPARNIQDHETMQWDNNPYGWGYVDNMGDDCTSIGDLMQCNRFRISDAIDAAGKPVSLEYIDFVKIQTGVNAKSGVLGEVSTEVLGVLDLHI